MTRMLLRLIWWLILLHLAEISVWGLFYLWQGCLPDAAKLSVHFFCIGTITVSDAVSSVVLVFSS